MRPLAIFCTLLVGAALCGCTSDRSDVSIRDSGVFIPSGRVSIDISPKAAAPSDPHSGHGLEIELTGASGSGNQTLDAGQQPITFAGRTFLPPQQLKGDFDFRFANVAYRWRRFFGDGAVGIEALGGLGFAGLDLTLASTTQSAKAGLNSAGGVGGFGLIWRIRPGTSLQTRLTAFVSGKSDAVNNASRFELFASQALGRHAAIKAGYSAWEVNSNHNRFDFSDASDIRVRFSGPALGLELMF
jgi:hypothetical protein